MPLQDAFDERVFIRSTSGLELDGPTPVEKTLDLIETQLIRLAARRLPSPAVCLFLIDLAQITSRLILCWNHPSLQAHLVLDKTRR